MGQSPNGRCNFNSWPVASLGLVKSLTGKAQFVTSNMQLQAVLSVALLAVCAYGGTTNREGKSLSLFNLVKFDNDVCAGSTKNGTCYTKEECKDRGGTESKTCAEGFGVCCVLELKCGKSSSDNNTYLIETTPKTSTGCTYTICPMASTICRIRYDFKEHTLADPSAATASFTSAATPSTGGVISGATGHCLTDSFTIVNNGGTSSPVICGQNNKDQHMILDSDGSGCQSVVFQVGGGTSTRKWDIHVTQYTCEEAENGSMGGPKGCLQYFNTDTGLLRSFNFPSAATVGTSGLIRTSDTHLANQDYKICIQKNPAKGRVCYAPIGTRATTAGTSDAGTFGVGHESKADSKDMESGGTNTQCTIDYLAFASGAHFAAASTSSAASSTDVFRICGRAFNGATTQIAKAPAQAACVSKEPFAIRVVFDGDEKYNGIKEKPLQNEYQGSVPGTIGFALVYDRKA